jgi:phospholipid/cholesterol/gamma-HCH transport system substrate-binding protein
MYDYVKQARWARLKVGLVITIAIVVVFLAVMFAGNIEKMFAPRIEIHASFDDVKGLREGSPVWFSGVEIGAVKDIQFTIQRHITVSMIIFQDTLQYLKKDSMAQILTLGIYRNLNGLKRGRRLADRRYTPWHRSDRDTGRC